MINAFIFDLGNVLYLFDLSSGMQFLKDNGASLSLLSILRLKRLMDRYELGKLTSREFYEEVKRETGLDSNFEAFRLAFSDIFRENPDSIPVARRLLRQYPVYILSNSNEMHIAFLNDRHSLLREVKGHVYSHEEGVAKPDTRIFQIALDRFHLNPESTLYIDDLKENTDAAASLGFATLHYPVKDGKPLHRLQDELTKRGIIV